MQHLRGSAIKIISQPDPVTLTTVVIEKIVDPDGTSVITNEATTLETVNSNVRAFYVWQSLVTNVVGRYTYVAKATNGIYSDRTKGFFYLEEV